LSLSVSTEETADRGMLTGVTLSEPTDRGNCDGADVSVVVRVLFDAVLPRRVGRKGERGLDIVSNASIIAIALGATILARRPGKGRLTGVVSLAIFSVTGTGFRVKEPESLGEHEVRI